MAGAAPERFGTLTQVGDDWQTVRGRMRRFSYALRRSGAAWSWCWQVEPNPKGTGHHVHFWQRGGFVKQRELSAAADREGMGRVMDIRRWEPRVDDIRYGVKLAGIDYAMKVADEEDDGLATYLAANGGRLVHASRGWWRDRDGQPCGQNDAMVAWSDDDETLHDWLVMREADVESFAQSRPTLAPMRNHSVATLDTSAQR